MTKNSRRPHRQSNRSEKKSTTERTAAHSRISRVKEFSKRMLHDYVIPMTRIIEHRLQRLEQSL